MSSPTKRKNKVSLSPRKRLHKPTDDNLPESEWVLQNQLPIQHQLFEESIGNMFNKDVLASPSKNRKSMKTKNKLKLYEKIVLENTYRLFGITFFPLVDPNDLEVDETTQKMNITRAMVGIRFDVYDQFECKYEQPFYILLKKKAKSDVWGLFKYTLPNYIDTRRIFQETTDGIPVSYEDIYIFSKEVYCQLLRGYSRKYSLQKLQQEGIISNIKADLRSMKVSFLVADIKLELYLEKDNISSCLISKGIYNPQLRKNWEVIIIGPLSDLKHKLLELREIQQ